MTDQDRIFHALGGVDDQFLEEAAARPQRVRPPRRWLVAAACLALITALSISVLAATEAGVRLKAFISNIWDDGTIEHGYDVEATLQKLPLSEIQGEVMEVENIIQEQLRTYTPNMSHHPGSWYRNYSTSDEALEYLGCDAIAFPDWRTYETQSTLTILGNDQGQFEQITLEVDYERGGLRMQAFAYAYTELYEGAMGTGARMLGSDVLTETTYTAANGQECVVIYCIDDNGSFQSVDGYIASGNVFYDLHVIYQEGQQTAADELLREWLDSFPA